MCLSALDFLHFTPADGQDAHATRHGLPARGSTLMEHRYNFLTPCGGPALRGVSPAACHPHPLEDDRRGLTPACPFCKEEYATQGFSLVELLIVLAIFSLLLGGVFSSLNEGQHSSQISRDETEMHQNLQDVLSLMSNELRTAGFPPETYYDTQYLQNPSTRKNLVAQGLVLAGPQEIVFQGDIDGDNTVDYVRYYLSGSSPPYSLNRFGGAVKPDGSLPGGSPQKLSEQVESFQLLYFNSSGVETSNVADMTGVEIQLTLRTRHVDPLSRVYRTVSESTRIRPLNL